MPRALLLARERAGGAGWLAVLDDEDLWRPEWGELPRHVCAPLQRVADGLGEHEVPTWRSAVMRAEARKAEASAERLAGLAMPRAAAAAAATTARLLFRSADRMAAVEKLRLAELRAWLGLRRVMREHWRARRGHGDGSNRRAMLVRPRGRQPSGSA